ncbi:MAG: FadR/GntR family transcriptional regulator [Anaerolineales bacterium]|jgi:GntR family transcriptional repressor for pyruvate dehydrogenase complex
MPAGREVVKFKPQVKRTLSESVIEEIASRIYKGELRPGQALPSERELCQKLQVGRTTLREALRGLQALHLVEILQGQGVFVASAPEAPAGLGPMGAALERESRLHLAEAREIIEVEVASLAATRAWAEQVSVLGKLLAGMEAASQAGRREEENSLHAQFHIQIAETCRNPVLTYLVGTLIHLLPAISASQVSIPGAAERAQQLHRMIFEAIRASDATGAREAMVAHMAHEEDVTAKSFQKRQLTTRAQGGPAKPSRRNGH